MAKDDDLELSRIYIQEGKPETALKSLHRALVKYSGGETILRSLDPRTLRKLPAELLSYYGLCVALVENRVQKGITLCKMAVEREMFRPEFYLNLGKVYLKADQKSKALEVFRKGLQITEKNTELFRELKRFGTRKQPLVKFLPRSNLLNRYVGLFLGRMKDSPTGKKRKGRTSRKS